MRRQDAKLKRERAKYLFVLTYFFSKRAPMVRPRQAGRAGPPHIIGRLVTTRIVYNSVMISILVL